MKSKGRDFPSKIKVRGNLVSSQKVFRTLKQKREKSWRLFSLKDKTG